MQSTMMRVPLSTNALLERAGRYFATREVVSRRPDKSLHRTTYGDIRRRARQLAKALVERAGIRPGDAVATLQWNHAAHLECYFGIPAAGAVLHTVNLRLSPEDVAYVVADAGDRLIIVDDVMLPLWERVVPLLEVVPRVVVHAFSGQPVPAGYEDYETFIAGNAEDYVYPAQDENDAVAMCHTSGTTGRPKGVVYSHRSMVLHALASCASDLFGTSASDNVLVITPMFHANAWAMPYSATMVGAKMVFPGPHMAGPDLLDLMEGERISLTLGVPTICNMILQVLQAGPARTFAGPIRMLVGGAAAPVSLIRGLDGFGIHIRHAWGMTETSPLGSVSYTRPEDAVLDAEEQAKVRALQGTASPMVEMRIIDEAGAECPWDGTTSGELQVRGPWITGGYHNLPPDPEKISADGWLRTGDVATIDPIGRMRIADRTKDLIKSGGEWISSVELENAVMGHPAIAEAAVVAIAHPKWDERPLVVAVRKPGCDVTGDDIRQYLAPHFARWQLPDDYAFIDAIPRSSTGKFLKHELRRQFADMISRTP
ncbi:MAG: long-chain fatty acid--CoA ligase [Zavarzinia sp.]|nr:long-chain fatty acid--CoA ligase [Zavarzinia sp.]